MRMQAFHRAYIDAIAAAAGVTTTLEPVDIDKTDSILKVFEGDLNRSWTFLAQLKSTSALHDADGTVGFDLDVQTFNKLCDPHSTNTPRLLIFMELPEEPDDWAICDQDKMLLRRRSFLTHLYGHEKTTNVGTSRVKVPHAGLLTPRNFMTSLKQVDAAFNVARQQTGGALPAR